MESRQKITECNAKDRVLKATENRGKIITEGKRQKANMKPKKDHTEGKIRTWNRGTTITECKSKLSGRISE